MYVRTWAYIFYSTHAYIHTYIHTFVHDETETCIHAHTHAHAHTHRHIHIRIQTCVCVHMYIHIYIYRYPAAQNSGHLCPGHAARTAAPLASIERLKVASTLQHRSLGLVDLNTVSLL